MEMQKTGFFGVAETLLIDTNPYANIHALIQCDNKGNTLGYALQITVDQDSKYADDIDEDGILLVTARKKVRTFKSIDTVAEYLMLHNIYQFNVCSIK